MDLQQSTRRLCSCRIRLLSEYPFFGHLAMRLNLVVEDDAKVPTACVSPNGKLSIGASFMESLTDAQLVGVLCHEILHIILFYWKRMGGRTAFLYNTVGEDADKKKIVKKIPAWNVAHDYAINLIIQEMAAKSKRPWIDLPKHALLDQKYKDMAAEAIYDDIMANTPDLDWDNVFWDVSDEGDEVPEDGWKRAILQAAQAHRMRGMELSDAIQKVVSATTTPSMSWQDRLAQWVGDTIGRPDHSYRRPSRRAESSGEILSTCVSQNMPEVIVLWDTSGSMNGHEDAILAEVLGILESTSAPIRVLTCDTEVHGDVKSRDVSDIIDHVKGGGGSDFNPAFARACQNAAPNTVIVALTDGEISVPAYHPPVQAVLWVLTKNGVDPTGGKWGHVIQAG